VEVLERVDDHEKSLLIGPSEVSDVEAFWRLD
jgi:hypothetical protein